MFILPKNYFPRQKRCCFALLKKFVLRKVLCLRASTLDTRAPCASYLPTSYHCLHFAMPFITKFADLVSVLCIYNFFITFAQLELAVFVHIFTASVLCPSYAMVKTVIWKICVQPLLSPFYRTPDMILKAAKGRHAYMKTTITAFMARDLTAIGTITVDAGSGAHALNASGGLAGLFPQSRKQPSSAPKLTNPVRSAVGILQHPLHTACMISWFAALTADLRKAWANRPSSL